MSRLWALLVVGLVACQALQERREVAAHIAAIENEMKPRLVIRGEPVKETLDLYHDRLEEAKRRM